MKGLLIRGATTDDAEQIAALVNAAYRPVVGAEGWTHESHSITGLRINREQVVTAVENTKVLIALRRSTLIGCVQIATRDEEAHIGMLAVLPSAQTIGLGKRLMEAAELYARVEHESKVFVLLVVEDRSDLIEYYRRRGYQLTDEFQPYPVAANVGTPVNPDVRLVVLRKG